MAGQQARRNSLVWAGFALLGILAVILIDFNPLGQLQLTQRILLITTVPLLGLGLAVGGWQGRRVGNEPLCARCGYNLTGLSGERCPECGQSVTEAGSIVLGRLRRRVWAVLAGCTVLLFSMSWGARLGSPYLREYKYQLYPFSWVVTEATLARPSAPTALRELHRRYRQGRLSDAQMDKLAAVALNQQGLLSRPRLSNEWADLLEAMKSAGRLTPAQTSQYYQQMILFSVVAPPLVDAGKRLTLMANCGKDSRAPRHIYTAYFLDEHWTFDDQQPPQRPAGRGGYSYIWPADGGQTTSARPVEMPPLKPGRHKLVHTFRLRLYRANFFARAHEKIDPVKDTPVYERQVRVEAGFGVVASGSRTSSQE
jgi:hypothetical protein